MPDKVFIARESLLTTLFKNQHFKTIYYIFVSILIIFLFNSMAIDYIQKGEYVFQYVIENLLLSINFRVRFGFHVISAGFGKFHLALLIWIIMFALNLMFFWAFLSWTEMRKKLDKKCKIKRRKF